MSGSFLFSLCLLFPFYTIPFGSKNRSAFLTTGTYKSPINRTNNEIKTVRPILAYQKKRTDPKSSNDLLLCSLPTKPSTICVAACVKSSCPTFLGNKSQQQASKTPIEQSNQTIPHIRSGCIIPYPRDKLEMEGGD